MTATEDPGIGVGVSTPAGLPGGPLRGSIRRSKKLGEVLVEQGLISAEDLERALVQQSRTDRLLGRVLLDMAGLRPRRLGVEGQRMRVFEELALRAALHNRGPHLGAFSLPART